MSQHNSVLGGQVSPNVLCGLQGKCLASNYPRTGRVDLTPSQVLLPRHPLQHLNHPIEPVHLVRNRIPGRLQSASQGGAAATERVRSIDPKKTADPENPGRPSHHRTRETTEKM